MPNYQFGNVSPPTWAEGESAEEEPAQAQPQAIPQPRTVHSISDDEEDISVAEQEGGLAPDVPQPTKPPMAM